MKHTITSQVLLLLVLISFLVQVVLGQFTDNFKKAINAATNEYIQSKEWIDFKTSLGYLFPVPTCTYNSKGASYPQTFNWTSNELVLCYEMGTIDPWPEVHGMAGKLLVKALKNQFGLTNLTSTFLLINTTEKGYFPSLKNAVDSGICHVAIASTNYEDNRGSQVEFQCPYGSSFTGVLRSSLDNDTIAFTDLNKEGVKIAAPYLTTSYTWAKTNFPKATILSNFGYATAYQMVLSNQIHAIVGESIEFHNWIDRNKANCSSCFVRVVGDGNNFGSFISKISDGTSSANTIVPSAYCVMRIILLFFVLIVLV